MNLDIAFFFPFDRPSVGSGNTAAFGGVKMLLGGEDIIS
jgi:hypothetical protein